MGIFMLLLVVVLLVVLLVAVAYYISIYNRLQSLRNGAEATLGQVRVALKKRLDMIEQLVESVKSYARFERFSVSVRHRRCICVALGMLRCFQHFSSF